MVQSIARSIFQLSRRDREFLPFSLMLRDEIENFFPLFSCFETKSRISVFTLVLWDETKKNVEKNALLLRDGVPFFSPDIEDTRDFNKDSLKYKYITQFPLLEFGSMRPSTAWVVDEKYWSIRSLVKIIFLNFCFHFCQNVTFQQDNVSSEISCKTI